MKKLILIGKSGSGKTTLTQRLKNLPQNYHKTQYIDYHDYIIDTPGEYSENVSLASALALYSYEADVVGLVISADEWFSLFPPNITCLVNRDVVGIITKTDKTEANPNRVKGWLKESGCKKIFEISSKTGKGIDDLLAYLGK